VNLRDWIAEYMPPSIRTGVALTQREIDDAYLADLRARVREEFFAANPRAALYELHALAREQQERELVSAGWVRNGVKRPRVRLSERVGFLEVFVHFKPALRWPVLP
jgi:hypothetical protein